MHPKSDIAEDSRFSKVFRDSKFKSLPKRKRKVKIDKRFQSMFTDEAFQVKYSVDKRGRRISKSTAEDLSKFYHLSSSDEEDNDVKSADEADDQMSSSDGDDNDVESADEDDQQSVDRKSRAIGNVPSLTRTEEDMIRKKQISGKIRKKLKDMNVDYARGEGKLFSESSSDESESEESEAEIYHEWNELDKDADTRETATKRLAICNMDWDKVKALDLMALFKSFLPAQGAIHSVIIYPSEFGLQRMAEEEVKGPAELVNAEKNPISDSDSDEDDAEEGKQYRMELMREYQLNRLKYYYAVAVFDSAETANSIYEACSGFEYQTSGILLDLRFVDDDIIFEQEPKDVCEGNVNLQKYQPLDFSNSALLQTKVELTWDETDPRRRELTQRLTEAAKKGDINDSDLEELVALSGSDDEDEEEDDILEALQKNSTPEEFAPFQHLLERKKTSKKRKRERTDAMDDGEKDEDDDENSKKSGKANVDDSDVDEAQRKAELELLLMDETNDNRRHFNVKQLEDNEKRKRKRGKFKKNRAQEPQEDDFQVDVNDARFSALYTSHLFNIDPTNPNFRKTKGMQAFVEEKQRRLSSKSSYPPSQAETSKTQKNAELSLLVKSVKSKTKSLLEKSAENKTNKRSRC